MSKNIFLMESVFLGAVAGNAVRQSPYHRPDNLELVLDKLHSLVGQKFEEAPMGVLELTSSQLSDLIKTLRQIPEYEQWNERKNGNQAQYSFTSRYSTPDPDNDFIDLDALEMNIFNDCLKEN